MDDSGFGRFLKVAGSLGIVAGSFYASLLVMDYWSSTGTPTEPPLVSPIKIEEATYGANCGRSVRVANATLPVAKTCDGHVSCNFLISVEELGDPAPGCGKNFSVRFKCDSQKPARTAYINGEANRSTVRINCG